MKRTNLIFAASLLVFATFMAACQKSETTDPLVETTQDDDKVTALFDDTQNDVDELTFTTTPVKAYAESSSEFDGVVDLGSRTDVKTISGDTLIHTITFVNYVNGRSLNGHMKNGVIIVKVIGRPIDAKFERTITLQNFDIDGVKIEGKRQIVKIADYEYTVTLVGGKVTFTDGTTYTHEFTRTRTWVEGYATLGNIWDDVFTVEGVATGTNRKGYAYTHTITNPLVIKNSCRWIVEGTIEMVSNSKTAVLDYGMGECDNQATITVNGNINDITLRHKR